MFDCLAQGAVLVLNTPAAADKCAITRKLADAWALGQLTVGHSAPPDRPARSERPQLMLPRDMPKRSYGGDKGRIGLLHALAHIELTAIDLAWDIVARFTHEDLPKAFFDDWVQVALDEALHFEMLEQLLNSLGASYGDLPAHDGLWQASEQTADDLAARLCVVPMTLECRGLDTTPATIIKLAANGDTLTPPALEVIYNDEIRHVAAGVKWFQYLAEKRGLDGKAYYLETHAKRYPAGLKAPFNHEGRAAAGFPRDWYEARAKT